MGMTDAESLSRTVKLFADSGAPTLDDAESIVDSYRLQVLVGDITGNIAHQAMVMTIVNSAVRAFRGGVDVVLPHDCDLVTGWHHGRSLSSAVAAYGGRIVDALSPDHPTLCVTDPTYAPKGAVVMRAVASGWRAAVVEGAESPVDESGSMVLAGVAAGGIAVAEAFEWRRGGNPLAGRRSNGISLWRPDLPWDSQRAKGPGDLNFAPSAWWLVGLGHLGQGYLWSIGMFPYAEPSAVRLMLQDDDHITEANESTGLLLLPGSSAGQQRTRKTRHLAALLEERGFKVSITERRLAPGDGPRGEEPAWALIGVDNPGTRRALSNTEGFELIIDAGLGGGPAEYLDMSIHTFPASRHSAEVRSWQEAATASMSRAVRQPAYSDRTARTGDECGTIELAGRAATASFVGATAGALVVAEGVRAIRGEHRHEVLVASMRDLDEAEAVRASGESPRRGSYALLA
jgi:hypothetical protein